MGHNFSLKPYFPYLQGNHHSGLTREYPLFTLVDRNEKEVFPGELFFSNIQVLPGRNSIVVKFYMGPFAPNQMVDAPPLYGFYLINLSNLHKQVLCLGRDSNYSCSAEIIDHQIVINQSLPKEIVRSSSGATRYSLDTIKLSMTCSFDDSRNFPLLELTPENVRQFSQIHSVLWERLRDLPRSDERSLYDEVLVKDLPPLYLYSVGDFLVFKEAQMASYFVVRWKLLRTED